MHAASSFRHDAHPDAAGAVLQSGQLITIELPEWLRRWRIWQLAGGLVLVSINKSTAGTTPATANPAVDFCSAGYCAGMAWGLTRFMHIDFMTASSPPVPAGLIPWRSSPQGAMRYGAYYGDANPAPVQYFADGPAIARFISTYAPKRSA